MALLDLDSDSDCDSESGPIPGSWQDWLSVAPGIGTGYRISGTAAVGLQLQLESCCCNGALQFVATIADRAILIGLNGN